MLRSFVLARCHDQINNVEKSFFYFKKRNELDLNHKSNDIDKNKALQIVVDRKNFFKENEINNWSILKSDNKNENLVFFGWFSTIRNNTFR